MSRVYGIRKIERLTVEIRRQDQRQSYIIGLTTKGNTYNGSEHLDETEVLSFDGE